MTKASLVSAVMKKTGMSKKEAQKAVTAMIRSISEALCERSERVTLAGFGTFEIVQRASRKFRVPGDPEIKTTTPKTAVRFRAGKELKTSCIKC